MVWVRNLSISFFLLTTFLQTQAQSSARAEGGVLDARSWSQDNPLQLQGYWLLYDQQLLSPSQLKDNRDGTEHFFPAIWNDFRKNGDGTGSATYTLKVILPDTVTRLTIEIPQLFSSFKLWANGQPVASAGKVGKTKKESEPKWIHQSVNVDIRDTLDLVLQISNFHHHKGGLKNALSLGSAESTAGQLALAMTVNVIESVILLAFGIFFFAYFMFTKKTVVLYFSLLSFAWSVRCLFSNLYPITLFNPDINWDLLVRVEYISLYGGVTWAMLFLHSLLRKFSNRIITYTVVTVNALFLVYTLIMPVAVFSQWVSLYLSVAAVVIIYGAVLVVRALLWEHKGSWFMLGSLLTGVIIFGYDILAFNTSMGYNYVLLSTGYVIIFLLTTIALLLHLEVLKGKGQSDDVLTYDEMFRK